MFQIAVVVVILCDTTSGYLLDSYQGPTCIRCDNTSSWTPCEEVVCERDEKCYVYVTEPRHQDGDNYTINAGCTKHESPECRGHHEHQEDIKEVCDYCCSDHNCILQHCAHRLHLQHLSTQGVHSCNGCHKRNGTWKCESTHHCRQYEVCYIQKYIYRSEIRYDGGCTRQWGCETVTLRLIDDDDEDSLSVRDLDDRHATVTAGRCCYASHCNTISSLLPPTTTTTTAAPARQCEVCSGQCDGHLTSCPADSTLCLTGVVNHQDGRKAYTKSCATLSECDERWLKDTTIKPECIGFHPDSTYSFNFNCTFCCTTDGCNRDHIPSVDSLYLKT